MHVICSTATSAAAGKLYVSIVPKLYCSLSADRVLHEAARQEVYRAALEVGQGLDADVDTQAGVKFQEAAELWDKVLQHPYGHYKDREHRCHTRQDLCKVLAAEQWLEQGVPDVE